MATRALECAGVTLAERNDVAKALLVVPELRMPCPEAVAPPGSAIARPLLSRDVQKSPRDCRRTWDFGAFAFMNIETRRGDETMNQPIVRLPQVRDLVALGRTAMYDRIKPGDFPKPVKPGRVSGRSGDAFGVHLVCLDGELQRA